jgi:hypothetical protein
MIGALTLATVIAVAPMSAETSMVGYSQSSYQGSGSHGLTIGQRTRHHQREARTNFSILNGEMD